MGAFEVGALWGLYFNDDEKTASKYSYDIITGVSAGALNTFALSLFEQGDEENAIKFLSEQWQSLGGRDVYKEWRKVGGIVDGVLNEYGAFDTSPLNQTLHGFLNQFGGKLKRKFVVSCSDVNSGSYVLFNESDSDPVKQIISSAAIPFVFPHINWDESDVVCMDGGMIYNTNLVSAVQRCRDEVDDDSLITLDILVCHGGYLDSWSDT